MAAVKSLLPEQEGFPVVSSSADFREVVYVLVGWGVVYGGAPLI